MIKSCSTCKYSNKLLTESPCDICGLNSLDHYDKWEVKLRDYIINDPLVKIVCKMPANHCVFCKHCTDIFYDFSNGVYMVCCEYNLEYGDCKRYEEEK